MQDNDNSLSFSHESYINEQGIQENYLMVTLQSNYFLDTFTVKIETDFE